MKVKIDSHFKNKVWEDDVELDADAPIETRLERIFRLFNRVDEVDCERLCAWGYSLPSLSVGDRVTLEGRTFEVAPVGFVEVTS